MNLFERRLSERRTIRLEAYDYASAGMNFVTICVAGRRELLGDVVAGDVRLWMEGQMVREMWDGLEDRYPRVATDAFVVMPNHVHGIVVLEGTTEAPASERVVGERADAMNRAPTSVLVDSNLVVSQVPSLGELERARAYIAGNPARWAEDAENPRVRD